MVLNNCIEKYGSFLSGQNCWVEVRLKVWLKQARNYALYIIYSVSFLCDPIDLLNTSDIFVHFPCSRAIPGLELFLLEFSENPDIT